MVKNILSNLKENKKYAILSPIFVIVEVFMDIALPYLMSLIIDRGISAKSKEDLLKIGVLLILSIVIAFVSGIYSGYFATKASSGLAKNLRESMFNNIQSFSFEDVDKFSTGSLITRMTTDVQNIQMAFQASIRIAIRSPLMLIFSFIMSFRIHRELAMNFLFIFPIIILGMYLIISKAHPIFSQIFKTFDRLNTIVSENLSGIRVVKSFVKEDHEIEKFNDTSYDLYEKHVKVSKLMAFGMPLMQFSIYLITILIAWFGAHFVVVGSLTTGELMSLITYAFQIQISLMILSMILVQVTISRNSAERVSDVLSATSSIRSPKNPVLEVANGDIEFNDVYFSYVHDSDKCALKNINLNIKSGDNVGIIGSTGSSKTTLINLIPRLYDTLSGNVKVSGVDVRDYDLKTLRDSVSVVLQKNQLFTGTIIENLRWGNEDASLDDVIKASKIAQAHDFILSESDQYDAKVERGGTNFSGGQRQRLCIARALLKKPKILILDDSTSALDNTTEQTLINELDKNLPSMTRIIISQRVNSLRNCDYIIVMDKGRINGIGTHDELVKTNKIYNEIVSTQVEGGDFDA
ncbi:ABC transporter ATP-binding protein [Peptoniphilus stercorisuis]|uniref:ATP-binding cassette subfamily B protein n=1 Tax=Peptoniphilus stercorisuis TaxID=1436965 RepID=A0ABS4K9S0_9FIRM|nr:ABC transporter ATP-binding protein [Peptoniphilus stercorisuis]MBP2024520.1 ATP-binding cassette subfamily B protein [Peptoniphilus stercorisuis]